MIGNERRRAYRKQRLEVLVGAGMQSQSSCLNGGGGTSFSIAHVLRVDGPGHGRVVGAGNDGAGVREEG